MQGAPSIRPLELLVLQPTPFCNLDCSYCYLPARDSKQRIAPETLKLVFEQVLRSPFVDKGFTVVWHAGEPLVMPIAFYEEAADLLDELDERGLDLSHSFQTNATLVDEAWCDFIRRRNIRVGVSVDGPAFLHDAHRKTRQGGGTFERVLRGIQCLQANEIEFHVISVVTEATLDHPRELFDFYVENGLDRIGFNVEEIEGVNASSSLATDDVESRLRRFFEEFLTLVDAHAAPMMVREFASLANFVARGHGGMTHNQENAPVAILNVDCDGHYTTFSPELLGMRSDRYGDFTIGNVHETPIETLPTNPRFLRLHEDVTAGLRRCQDTCSYFALCGGGSPANKIFENGSFDSAETLHCRLTKKLVADITLDRLESHLGA